MSATFWKREFDMSLKDKASKIDFGSLGALPPVTQENKQPKTAPGAMMAFANDQRSDLLRENENLRIRAGQSEELEARLNEAVHDLREWDGAKPTRLLDPRSIIPSAYSNRHPSSFVGAEFETLKREIADAGVNVQPIKVRAITDGTDDARYEIVFGHRRHEACRQLSLPVLAMVDNLNDKALFVEMDRENRVRADLSPWEQGVMYARALDKGLFASAKQLAAALGVDASNLGKALALARLPAPIIEAFSSPLDIQYRWIPALNAAVHADSSGVIARALQIAGVPGMRSAKQVMTALLQTIPAEGAGTVPPPVRHPLLKDGQSVGQILFGPENTTSITFQFNLPSDAQHQLVALMQNFLNEV